MRHFPFFVIILLSIYSVAFPQRDSVASQSTTIAYWSFDSVGTTSDTTIDISGHGFHLYAPSGHLNQPGDFGRSSTLYSSNKYYYRVVNSGSGSYFNLKRTILL